MRKFFTAILTMFSFVSAASAASTIAINFNTPCTTSRQDWICVTATSFVQPTPRPLEIRWNVLSPEISDGAVLFVHGGTITNFLSDYAGPTAVAVQDALALYPSKIRSIEFRFTDSGISVVEAKGFPHSALVYNDILQWIHESGLASSMLLHHGNSSGATIAAAALSHLGAEQYLDGVVFGGGPFWSNLVTSCQSQYTMHRNTIDNFNWPPNHYCLDQEPASQEFYDKSILVSPFVIDIDYSIPLTIVVGVNDELPWIYSEAVSYAFWLNQNSTTEVVVAPRPEAPHLVISSIEGATAIQTALLGMADIDGDGIINNIDNCSSVQNGPTIPICVSQSDVDFDGFGDFCDTDVNNDGATSNADVSLVAYAYHYDAFNLLYDFDCDGVVTLFDVQRVYADSKVGAVPGPACGHAPGIPCP